MFGSKKKNPASFGSGKKRTGNVYYANSRKIDATDEKPRRQYVVVRDSGKYVSVSKIRGLNSNEKNSERLYMLDKNKYPLTKESGVDNYVYSRRSDNSRWLKLDDKEVFDIEKSFKLTSHDTHNVLVHTGQGGNKKGRRK